jgi:hypothetical protein
MIMAVLNKLAGYHEKEKMTIPRSPNRDPVSSERDLRDAT